MKIEFLLVMLVGAFAVTTSFATAQTQPAAQATNPTVFRIETETFEGTKTRPISTNLTLCSKGVYYDFLTQGDVKEIVIYDQPRKKFTILNVENECRTEISEERVLEFLVKLKEMCMKEKDTQKYADVEFIEQWDSEKNHLSLKNTTISYSVKGPETKSRDRLDAYLQFANWFQKFKSTVPQSFPPFARLKLNKAIEKHKLIPEEVEFSLRIERREINYRTRHTTTWLLSEEDRKRIDETRNKIVDYDLLTLSEYYQEIQASR